MNVPQQLNLANQTFNSNFLEFVWQFPKTDDEQDQVILVIYKNGNFYLEFGPINSAGDYIGNVTGTPTFEMDGMHFSWFFNPAEWDEIDYIKRFFTFDGDLYNLTKDSVEYLNSI
jgi:hypothetical protein